MKANSFQYFFQLLLVLPGLVFALEKSLDHHELAVFALTNQFRMDPDGFLETWKVEGPGGLTSTSPLGLYQKLINSAQAHSQDMADCNKMQHKSCDGTQWNARIRSFVPNAKEISENIAHKQTNALVVMKSWINSSGHRKNILNPVFNTIGVGHVFQKDQAPE